ncbi:hypothetical protein L226DRAFT_132363 [Lentinus tigrinus ALCF2SS1-7]|uniref:uncharacterized protein n=1 Tax=Lentinus tigrinus ALCF2SS1-7 TaxID=1328758 RepID=UPI001165EAA0|nr:hypothetical protein L226DRAFT_132363 [Lentinus tigrinus ALCF2SS1-7]
MRTHLSRPLLSTPRGACPFLTPFFAPIPAPAPSSSRPIVAQISAVDWVSISTVAAANRRVQATRFSAWTRPRTKKIRCLGRRIRSSPRIVRCPGSPARGVPGSRGAAVAIALCRV